MQYWRMKPQLYLARPPLPRQSGNLAVDGLGAAICEVNHDVVIVDTGSTWPYMMTHVCSESDSFLI